MLPPDLTNLRNAVRKAFDKLKDFGSISPALLATQAMVDIEFPRELHSDGYAGCHAYARQIARQYCARKYEAEETDQHDLFPDLQKRYPKSGSGDDPQYVMLELLTKDDIVFNVSRLRSEGDAKLRHADALETWGENKFPRAPKPKFRPGASPPI